MSVLCTCGTSKEAFCVLHNYTCSSMISGESSKGCGCRTTQYKDGKEFTELCWEHNPNKKEISTVEHDLGLTHGFVTKDSGKRTQFNSGMVRDTSDDKIRYDLVYMPMFKRWADLMTRGAKKYEPNNWKKASTYAELERFRESAFRHFMQWFLEENKDEDHGAAVFFNISGAEYVKEKLDNGVKDA